MNLQDIRKKYPQYDDLADEELVSNLHARYYSDIPQKEFYSKVGFKVKTIPERLVDAGKSTGKVVTHTVASMAQAPVAALEGMARGAMPGKDFLGTAEQTMIERQKALDEFYLTKPEEKRAAQKIGSVLSFPFEQAGEGMFKGTEAMLNRPLEGTIAEPILKTAGQAFAVAALGAGGKKGKGLGKISDVVSEKTKAKLSEKVVTEKPKELVKTDIISEEAPKAYKVTVKDDSGKVIVGKEGETHAQQIDRLIQEGEPVSWGNETGFIDEAGKYIKQEQSPKVAAVLEKGKPAGVAKSIEAKAIEQGLIKDGFDNLAEYDPTTIKIQSERAADLLTDVEKTRRIVRGEEPIPEGLRGAAVIKAVEEHIKKTKDADMAAELANSNLATEVSLAGQELSLIRGRELDTPTAKLQAVKKARQEQAKLAPEKEVKIKRQLKEETKKNNLTKEEATWNRFLREIVC